MFEPRNIFNNLGIDMKTFTLLALSQLLACGNKTPAENAAPAANEETTEVVAEDNTDNPVSIEDLEHFGLEFTLDSSIPAGTVLTNPDDYVGKTVRVTGKVSDVCQKMGCWMVITDADQHMRITTKDHKFFVAKDGAGATCDLEGTVVKREASPARTEHFKSEQSEGAPIPAAEEAGEATYEIVASAIRFDRSTISAPVEAVETTTQTEPTE